MSKAFDTLKEIISIDTNLSEYSLGYYNMYHKKFEVVPFTKIVFDGEDPSSITILKEGGKFLNVPMFRILRIYRGKNVIWSKELKKE